MVVFDYLQQWARDKSTNFNHPTTLVDPPNFHPLADDPLVRASFGSAFVAAIPPEPLVDTDFHQFLWRIRLASVSLPRMADTPPPSRDLPWTSKFARVWDLRCQHSATRENVDNLLFSLDNAAMIDTVRQVEAYTSLLRAHPWLAWRHVFLLQRSETPSTAVNTAKIFHDHFNSLMCPLDLPEPPPLHPLPVLDPPPRPFPEGPFTLQEFTEAVSKMRNHKSPGIDGLHIEIFRCPEVCAAAVPITNHVFEASQLDDPFESLPTLLLDAFLTPVYKKKGDKNNPASYRPVVLLELDANALRRHVRRRRPRTLPAAAFRRC